MNTQEILQAPSEIPDFSEDDEDTANDGKCIIYFGLFIVRYYQFRCPQNGQYFIIKGLLSSYWYNCGSPFSLNIVGYNLSPL